MGKASTSLLFAEMRESYPELPIFSYDAGFVLNPEHADLSCVYGEDGSVDFGGKACYPSEGSDCVTGCGFPPAWCERREAKWCGWVPGGDKYGIRPWRPADLAIPMLEQRNRGGSYRFGGYNGYNELVIKTDRWVANLPEAVEAIFLVKCAPDQQNTVYPNAWAGIGRDQGEDPNGNLLADSCAEAHEVGRRWHRDFLHAYGLDSEDFPLLLFDANDWDTPFQRWIPSKLDIRI